MYYDEIWSLVGPEDDQKVNKRKVNTLNAQAERRGWMYQRILQRLYHPKCHGKAWAWATTNSQGELQRSKGEGPMADRERPKVTQSVVFLHITVF